MKALLKKLVLGTFLEPFARKVNSVFIKDRVSESLSDADDMNRKYDIQTIEVMKRVLKNDSNCIDVGCHQGSILREILNLAPKGNHFVFEPLPEMYQELIKSFGKIHNLHIFDYALSDVKGLASFQHVVSNPGYSGFRKRRYDRPNEQIQEISVKTELLDKLIPKNIPIHFIKVDVEGAELQVIKGAKETIKRCCPVIVFEHGLGAADYYGTIPGHLFELLATNCGLRLFLMSDWLQSSGRDALSKEEFCEHFYSGNYYFMAAE